MTKDGEQTTSGLERDVNCFGPTLYSRPRVHLMLSDHHFIYIEIESMIAKILGILADI